MEQLLLRRCWVWWFLAELFCWWTALITPCCVLGRDRLLQSCVLLLLLSWWVQLFTAEVTLKRRGLTQQLAFSLASSALLLSVPFAGGFWVCGDFYKIEVLQSCWRGRNRSDSLYTWHVTMRWGSSRPAADNLSVGLIHILHFLCSLVRVVFAVPVWGWAQGRLSAQLLVLHDPLDSVVQGWKSSWHTNNAVPVKL